MIETGVLTPSPYASETLATVVCLAKLVYLTLVPVNL